MTAPVPGLAPLQSQIQTTLVAFIQAFAPGVEIVEGQDNRVASPNGDNFFVLTPGDRSALSTSIRDYADARFTASIAGTVLTVTAVDYGEIGPGLTVWGVGVADGTMITANGTGTGGVGNYAINTTQAVGSVVMAAGVLQIDRPTRLIYSLDAHGDGSADNLQGVITAFRDLVGCDFFRNNGDYAVPLYAEDPRQLPFINENQQIENRWCTRFAMQINPVLTLPQQFADKVDVARVAADAFFPA